MTTPRSNPPRPDPLIDEVRALELLKMELAQRLSEQLRVPVRVTFVEASSVRPTVPGSKKRYEVTDHRQSS